MPTTFQAVAAIALGLLPGALYFWSFERQAGAYGVGLSDRIFRFIGASAVLQALAAPVTYWFWIDQWPVVSTGGDASWWLWALVVSYVAVPTGLGSWVGILARHRSSRVRWLTGPDLAPRAWDHLFAGTRDGWVRIKLMSGTWVGGGYATSTDGLTSYASGYPHAQEIYVSTAVALDPETGEFLRTDSGDIRILHGGILVRWDEVEYLEFIDGSDEQADEGAEGT